MPNNLKQEHKDHDPHWKYNDGEDTNNKFTFYC
jgi:hypothetical protein